MNEEKGVAEEFAPEPEFVVRDLETLRVVADPLRMQILEVTLDAPRTVKEIAATLRTTPGKLYYHVNMLEEHGLLRVAGTRLVSGIVEKRYRRAARRLRPDPALFDRQSAAREEAVDLLLGSILDTTRRDIDNLRAAIGNGLIDISPTAPVTRRLQVVKTVGRLTEEQAAAFSERLHALVREFRTQATFNTADQACSLTIMFHPMQLAPGEWPAPGEFTDVGPDDPSPTP